MKRIVIVGAGYAGLECALTLQRALARRGARGQVGVTLVNKRDYHYPATLLHRVSLGTYSARKGRVFCRNVLDCSLIDFRKDDVAHIDLDGKTVHGTLDSYPYDYLVLSAGFIVNDFGIPGVDEHAYKMDTMNTAERLLAHMEASFKDYSYAPDPKKLRFAVVGSGFTGVEYAAELTDRARELCRICGIDHALVEVTLIGRHEEILPMLGDKGGRIAKRRLGEMGVKYLVGSAVAVDGDGVDVRLPDGSVTKVSAGTVLWAAGVKGSPLVADCGLPAKGNRVAVDDHLRAPGRDDVFVLGDCAAFTGQGEDRPYPATGQIAQQMGRYAGEQVFRLATGRGQGAPFKYHYRGTVCSLSHRDAVGVVGPLTMSGEMAALTKNFIENKWFLEMGGVGLVLKKGQFRNRTSD